eukprot:TRINITY_DN17349_c0_g1_i1.p1 TRINITY_DN17349_c0_g1~~TRINITY_DN17349_c0_g1_i1.p1  ORF type:complete len:349 (-),score=68.75 TRINITY_DN17349_c0_g1_i1:448-1494(-)
MAAIARLRNLTLVSKCLLCRSLSSVHPKKGAIRNGSRPLKPESSTDTKSCMTLGQKCKNILASNMEGVLTTVKADAKGSKSELHSSSVKYIISNRQLVMWVTEEDFHTVNLLSDERGSLCVNQTSPPALVGFLHSIGRFPSRVTLVGDIVRLEEDEIDSHRKELEKILDSERQIVNESGYSVTEILNSSKEIIGARAEALQTLLEKIQSSGLYTFKTRSCDYVDISRERHEVNLNDTKGFSKDEISSFSGALIEGINRSDTRRLGLMLFCYVYMNVHARDALLLSIDSKGFEVFAKVSNGKGGTSSVQFEWRALRFPFDIEVRDIVSFCRILSKMEDEALKKVSGSVI